VVDATGRGPRNPIWLEALGYVRPDTEQVRIGLGYATRTYRLPADALGGDLLGFARSLRFPDIYETILTPRRWTTRSPSASGSASGTATSGWTAPPEPFPAQACSGPGYRRSL
jgi:hypothetical protein